MCVLKLQYSFLFLAIFKIAVHTHKSQLIHSVLEGNLTKSHNQA